jgi:hypothetical protein
VEHRRHSEAPYSRAGSMLQTGSAWLHGVCLCARTQQFEEEQINASYKDGQQSQDRSK